MWNSTPASGVYTIMLRVPILLLCSVVALAQRDPVQDPMDIAIQAVWTHQNNRQPEEAATARDHARALLQSVPAASPRFAGWAQQVAQFYQNANWNGTARTILQDALSRTAGLPDSDPSRLALLNALGESWRQDGNLLKAVPYLERAAAAQAVKPPAPARGFGQPGVMVGNFSRLAARPDPFANIVFGYTRLAELYRQLGRPDAVTTIAAKIRALGPESELALAQFYAQNGPLEEAAAIYRKLAEQSTDPQDKANAWQALANLAAQQQQFSDAAAAMQQAMSAAQSSDKPYVQDQATWMRQTLIQYLRQAGQVGQADQVYQQVLQQVRGGPQESQTLAQYAQYLSQTDRAAQGESLLQNYLAGDPNLAPQQKSNLLHNLASLAQTQGDSKRAEEYRTAAQALRSALAPPTPQILIGEDLRKAQTALNEHRWDDAYGLALRAIDAAHQASDKQQLRWAIPQLANQFAANKQPGIGERLFQLLLAFSETARAEDIRSLMEATQNYARFVSNQPDRRNDVPGAINRYRDVLSEANGPDSASLAEVWRLQIEFESAESQWNQAEGSARELVALQESLSGTASIPYLRDLRIAAEVFRSSGNYAGALPLLRQAIAVSDLHAAPNDQWLRDQTRMDAALALAHLGQFDEAEALREEALALQRPLRSPRTSIAQDLAQIRRMKQLGATAQASRINP